MIHVLGCGPDGPDPLREGAIFGGISQPIVKYRECPAFDRYSQPHLVGGSSNASFRDHYCSNL